jgi:hypothetical protein
MKEIKATRQEAMELRRLKSKLKYSPYIIDEYIQLYVQFRRKQFVGTQKAFEKKIKF